MAILRLSAEYGRAGIEAIAEVNSLAVGVVNVVVVNFYIL